MKLDDVITQLEALKKEHGGDIDVLFDTEGAEYNCHMVPVDGVHLVPEEAIGHKEVCLTTSQHESRNHCTSHNILEISNEKVEDAFVCTKCGKLFNKGNGEELKKLMALNG